MWSPLDKVTAGAKSVELLIFRKYSNIMLEDAEQCKSSDCDCVKKIGVLFVLYQFVVIVSYLLLFGGLWQLEVILRKTIRNRCETCQRKTIKVSKKECKNCTFTDLRRKHLSLGNVSFTDETEQHRDELDSSGDTIDENILFVTYREDDTEDFGFQDDDYNDILANSQFAGDDHLELEVLLQQQDIDWDSPVPIGSLPSLNDSFQDDCTEIYFDEDFVTILGVTAQSDAEIFQIDEFVEKSNLAEKKLCNLSSINAPSHVFESLRTIRDVTSSDSRTLDNDVLAAIVGESYLEENNLSTAKAENERFLLPMFSDSM